MKKIKKIDEIYIILDSSERISNNNLKELPTLKNLNFIC